MNVQDMDDDALLSAYVDGELSPAEADRLTERLATEPALLRRLEQLRSTDDAVRRHFAAIDERPLPQGVIDLLELETERGNDVVAFAPRGLRSFLQMPVALAAGLALVVGFIVSDLTRRAAPPGDNAAALLAGRLPEDSALYRLLESGVSAEPVRLSGGATAEIVLTFEDVTGSYCRQFALAQADGTAAGLACREDGAWRLETVARAAAAPAGDGYRMAGGGAPPALEAALAARMGAAEALSLEQERAIISESWKKTPE